MKIAHVTATFPPYWAGTGNVAYHNARLMHERGHDVTVFTASSGECNPDFPFSVERLPTPFRIGNAALTPGLLGRLRGFDVVHLHYPNIFGAELTTAASRLFRMPLIVTYHNDLVAGGLKGALFRGYTALNQRLVLRGVTRLIATSRDYAENSYLARTAWGTRIHVVPNGVDEDVFSPSVGQTSQALEDLGVARSGLFALFVGALDRAHYFKGVDVLLRATARVADLVTIIVGDGDLRGEYESLAARVAPGRVRFAGKVDLPTLVDLYRAAHVTVLPSVTRGEAFGMVLIESMACGTPVIATDLPGVRTVVDDGVDGIVLAPGDAKALAAALSRLVTDREEARAMGRAGREKILREYRWELIGDRLEALYREVLLAS